MCRPTARSWVGDLSLPRASNGLRCQQVYLHWWGWRILSTKSFFAVMTAFTNHIASVVFCTFAVRKKSHLFRSHEPKVIARELGFSLICSVCDSSSPWAWFVTHNSGSSVFIIVHSLLYEHHTIPYPSPIQDAIFDDNMCVGSSGEGLFRPHGWRLLQVK